MKKKNGMWLTRAIRGVIALALTGVCQLATADPFGIQIAGAIADDHIHKLDLGLVWNPNLTWRAFGGWHFSLVGEGHLAWWHTDEGNVHQNIGEIGITPVVRFIKEAGAVRPFIEAGVGVRLLSSPRISTTLTLSSAFQFADMVGVGAQFGGHQQYQAGFRFQHVSNGGIKEPNPGINFSQIYLQYNF